MNKNKMELKIVPHEHLFGIIAILVIVFTYTYIISQMGGMILLSPFVLIVLLLPLFGLFNLMNKYSINTRRILISTILLLIPLLLASAIFLLDNLSNEIPEISSIYDSFILWCLLIVQILISTIFILLNIYSNYLVDIIKLGEKHGK